MRNGVECEVAMGKRVGGTRRGRKGKGMEGMKVDLLAVG